MTARDVVGMPMTSGSPMTRTSTGKTQTWWWGGGDVVGGVVVVWIVLVWAGRPRGQRMFISE